MDKYIIYKDGKEVANINSHLLYESALKEQMHKFTPYEDYTIVVNKAFITYLNVEYMPQDPVNLYYFLLVNKIVEPSIVVVCLGSLTTMFWEISNKINNGAYKLVTLKKNGYSYEATFQKRYNKEELEELKKLNVK